MNQNLFEIEYNKQGIQGTRMRENGIQCEGSLIGIIEIFLLFIHHPASGR